MKTGRKIIIVLSDNQRILPRSTVRYNTPHIDCYCKSSRFPSARNHYKHHHHTTIMIMFGHTRTLLIILYPCEYKAYLCFVTSFLDRLHELVSRGSCQCRGEGFGDSGSGSGTTFWFIGCSGNWQDCKDPGFMTSCCREQGKKWTSATVREPIYQ